MNYPYKGYTIHVVQDADPMNPRTEFDNVTTMVFEHKRYNLGDKDHGLDHSDYSSWAELEAGIRKKYDVLVLEPVYMYDHSGITIRTRPFECPWDSGQIGFVFITRQKAKDLLGIKRVTKAARDWLCKILEQEVRIYDDYLTGSVYGYVIDNPDGERIDDSCWGYYGTDADAGGPMISGAMAAVDWDIAEREKAARPENKAGQLCLEIEGIQ